jgi:hypothetical protein
MPSWKATAPRMLLGLIAVTIFLFLSCDSSDRKVTPQRLRAQEQLGELERDAASTFGLTPPVSLDRVSVCTCGHATFSMTDSEGKSFKFDRCNGLPLVVPKGSVFDGVDPAVGFLFVDKGCHTYPPDQRATRIFAPNSEEEEAVISLLAFWLVRTFSLQELDAIEKLDQNELWEHEGPFQYAQSLLIFEKWNPERFAPMSRIRSLSRVPSN